MVTLQFIPYQDLSGMEQGQKINKLLRCVRDDKIVLVEGRLDAGEEALLIEKTMEEISRNFKGVDICSVEPGRNGDMFKKFRTGLARVLLGNRGGFTIIGPASVVREIRKDPNKIELLTAGKKKRK